MPTNRLIQEKSPYLLQHAHNPVDWYPWGEEAFAKAAAEDKPIFLSVGYSTCHWCHVMERESFENGAIAAILNRDFVSVKVDREERPDVDRIYMLFVQATTGSGGWPMSVWMTPDRTPFFGGTYFAPDARYGRPGFAHILEQIATAWKTRRDELLQSGAHILGELKKHAAVSGEGTRLDEQALDSCQMYFRRTFDKHYGGFGGAPKFPRPSVLNFLLRRYRITGDEEALEMTLTTLREMARGGMNDQLGGGFHRYSVDERWFVPHFEKMLYDQAQLAVSYLEAFQITRDEQYASVARSIFEYVLRDMTHAGGGFFSAEDADSAMDPANPHEKGEGAFYIFAYQELIDLLGKERAEWFAFRYGCRPNGNVDHDPHGEFTGRNILFEAQPAGETERRFSIPQAAVVLDECKAILFAARAQRPRPHLDDKILTAWNGLMISAFAKGAQVLGEARYERAARRAADFVLASLYDAERRVLRRRWRAGEAAIDGFLDDYAAFVQGLLDLYEASFDVSLVDRALELTVRMAELFEDRENGGFFSSADGADLVMRLKEDYDGAEPAGNSIAIANLLRLSVLTGKGELAEMAEDALEAFAPRLNQQPVTLPQMCCSWMLARATKSQIILAGRAIEPLLAEVRSEYLPFTAVLALRTEQERARFGAWLPAVAGMGEVDGRAAAYVCENFACQLPVADPAALRGILKTNYR